MLINKVADLTTEITRLTQSLTDYQDSTTKQIEESKKQLSNQAEGNAKQNEVIAKQQKYLEQIDRKERECSIVILGVPEDGTPLDDANNDFDKVKKIWDAAGITTEMKSLRRLGRPDTDKKRPILVVVPSRGDRDSTLEKAKELNKAGEVYKYIYIKKDIHPSVREEWKRLHEVVKKENERSANEGCTITFNIRERKVYKDNVVIDQWNLQGF